MPFEAINCPNCGGSLEFDSFGFIIGRGVCRYCNTAIRRIAGSEEAEKWCQRVYGYETIGEGEKAREEARAFAESFPGDFRAWMMDYELNADHAIGTSYNPRPTAIERMCLTVEDDIDRRYLREVSTALKEDEKAIVSRAADLGGEIKQAERARKSTSHGNWRESVSKDIEEIERRIDEVKERASSNSGYVSASYADYASGFATICGILLTIAMIMDGCSKNDAYSAFQGILLGPLGGLLFGAPFGAVLGVAIAALVNLARKKAAEYATKEDEKLLSSLMQEKQEKRAELGLAMDAGIIEDELNHLLWAKDQTEIGLAEIAEAIGR